MYRFKLLVGILLCVLQFLTAQNKSANDKGIKTQKLVGSLSRVELSARQMLLSTITKMERGPKEEHLSPVTRQEHKVKEDRVRVRKGVSSSSIVTFKKIGRTPRRRYAYPSNWGQFSLFCKTGWLLQVLPNGVVNGTRNVKSPYALLQIQVLTTTLVRIKGVKSGRYIGINSKGRLISKRYPSKDTLFQEEVLENYYHTFNSSLHPKVRTPSWYMGIRKNGNPKKASRTKVGETCIQFLKLPAQIKRT